MKGIRKCQIKRIIKIYKKLSQGTRKFKTIIKKKLNNKKYKITNDKCRISMNLRGIKYRILKFIII